MPLLDFEKTVPYVKKKGIAGYFQLIRHNASDLVILNVLFLLTSIPIITIGPSILALNQMTMAMVRDIPSNFVKDYFRHFKKYFRDGIVCGAVFLICLGVSSFSFIYYFSWGKSVPIMYIFSAISLICFLLIVMASSYFFPMFCCVDLKKTVLLKNSVLLSLSCLKNSLVVLGFIVLVSALIAAFSPYTMFVLLIGPISLIFLAACYGSWDQIKEHVISEG